MVCKLDSQCSGKDRQFFFKYIKRTVKCKRLERMREMKKKKAPIKKSLCERKKKINTADREIHLMEKFIKREKFERQKENWNKTCTEK